MIKISKTAKSVMPSQTLEITAKAKSLKAEGKDIIMFTAGEPDFNTPEYIIQSAKNSLDKGYTKYTPSAGIVELRRAVCTKLAKENGLKYNENQIVVTDGAKSALYHALLAMIDAGDEVIIPSPYWVSYVEQVGMVGGKAVIVEGKKSNGYKVTASDVEKAITDKTRVIMINSPCNPTGAVYSESELKEIANLAEKYGLTVISDEIYEKLVFGESKHISIASLSDYMKENTVVVNGVSKTYSMTGWRIGYLACEENLAKNISKLQGHTTSNAVTFAQYATVDAIDGGKDFIEKMHAEFDRRRQCIISLLKKIDGIDFVEPYGAFYVFVDVSKYYGKSFGKVKIDGSSTLARELLNSGVAVIPGVAFGNDDCLRLSYCIEESQIREGISRFKDFLYGLK